MADLWKIVADVATLADGEIVYIGGVAVYLHTAKSVMPPEMTHDADAAISIVASSTLRETYEIVANKRLKKIQITAEDIEVDLYVEHQNGLRFDYSELAMYAVKARNYQIACLAHLLLLKIGALRDRGASAHGAKDRRDIAKLLVMLAAANGDNFQLVLGYATDDDMKAMTSVIKSSAFMEIARRNAQTASKLRAKAEAFVKKVKSAR